VELDAEFEAISLNAPESWQYSTRFLEGKNEHYFTSYFDVYSGRHVAQAWNVIRLVRILLNEFILENGRDPPEGLPGACSPMVAKGTITTLTFEICASVPQYVDCLGIGRDVLSMKEDSKHPGTVNKAIDTASHVHSPEQYLACYSLIFPLSVAGQSKACPETLKLWITKELHYMANHFYMRNAEVVARIIERGTLVNAWDIYTLLGSYAFVA
jgi:hypothetical protein